MHKRQSRAESLRNTLEIDYRLESDYILCPRGGGNFLFQFFEILSIGRIPSFIDTGCYLPYNEWMDWSKLGIFIKEEPINQRGDIIHSFHKRISHKAFKDL